MDPAASSHANAIESLLAWREAQVRRAAPRRERLGLAGMRAWVLREGRLSHASGSFFAIGGLRCHSRLPELDGVEQPIIHQPEIGILGFVLRGHEGRPQLLVQAKAEPGNVGEVQLAPTVQATRSNYTRVHGGTATPYLAYFVGAARGRRLADTLQSEQGTRFLGKFNRNVTVAVPGAGPEPASEAWRWLDVASVLGAVGRDYCVNTDARSVLTCSDWRALVPGGRPFARWRGGGGFGEALLGSFEASESPSEHADDVVSGWLDRLRAGLGLRRTGLALDDLAGWRLERERLVDVEERAFEVRGYRVEARTREVPVWDQPLVHTLHEERVDLVTQRRRGVLHLLLRASAEAGLREGFEFGPSVQEDGPRDSELRDPASRQVAELARDGTDLKEHAGCLQSDEGGRFHRSRARYRVVELPEYVAVPDSPRLCWATLRQVAALLRRRGQINNELRSALSLLLRFA